MLQQTLDDYQVCCSASRRLHGGRCPFHIRCLQAAAATRIEGQPDISTAARIGDCALVYCHLVANSDGVHDVCNDHTPLHASALRGQVETCRLLLQCNADLEAKNDEYLLPPLLLPSLIHDPKLY